MPKTMMRSRGQLASSYAPESFFTFEGGLGACIAKPILTRKADLDADTRNQIALRMDELTRAWFDAAMGCRKADEPAVLPAQCIEKPLLSDGGTVAPFNEERFAYLIPDEVGYAPAPLTFVCNACRLVRTYESLKQLESELDVLENPARCPHPVPKRGSCDWRQLDVLLVHWSGGWERMMPHQWRWSQADQRASLFKWACDCGSENVVLDQTSPAIGEWFFRCASPTCGRAISKVPQKDRETLEILRTDDQARWTDLHMEAVSYRASQVHYTQSDQFINFRDDKAGHLRLLLPGNEGDLQAFIARRYGYERTELSSAEIEKAVKDAKLDVEWERFESQVAAIASLEEAVVKMKQLEGALTAAKRARDEYLVGWEARKIIRPKVALPDSVRAAIQQRAARYPSRYDPFRLAVEHAALQETKLAPNNVRGGRRAFVPFDRLDQDLAPDTVEEKEALESQTAELLRKLGIEQMGLIREFELCRFSFGYSRMSPGPVLPEKRGRAMPVKLKLFPVVRDIDDKMKYPIYVITQANEALYVKLNERAVFEWLSAVGCDDMFTRGPSPDWRPGAGLLAVAPDFDRYLQHLQKAPKGLTYYYAYTLLHTLAHVMMKQISEFSGLDQGSLSEYIFPADLAFVVYRSGTTMDLGNLSALWRNSGIPFLRSLLRHKATDCGSGSLCLHRGGACPDCVMVPETSCVAGNALLSRSVLRGNGRPRQDERQGSVPGFLEIVRNALPAGA